MMATASRTRPSAAPGKRTASPNLTALLVLDALRTWVIPVLGGVVIVALAALSAAEIVSTSAALAGAIFAALVLLLYVGERPLLAADQPRQGQLIGAALGVVWLVACYVPFHTRIFPGKPLVDAAQVSPGGAGLPLRIPSAGHAAVDLQLEGRLAPNPSGGIAPPVHYRLVVEGAAGSQVVDGQFEETLKSQRLGRRGSTTVKQAHNTDVRVLANPGGGDLTITQLTLEPVTAPAIAISAFAHPLPGPIVLALATLVLLAATLAFDRLGPAPETDGALTLATAAVIGTAIIFWTSNALHPDFHTLIGSAIFGGPLGFAGGAAAWWIAKKLVARPGH